MYQRAGEPVHVHLFIADSLISVVIDQEVKGSKKCPALKGYGFYQNPNTSKDNPNSALTSGRSFADSLN